MRVNINKLQGGGLISFTPIFKSPQETSQVESSTGSGSGESELLDKEAYKELIKTGGLVNDVNQFVEQLNSLQSDPLALLNKDNSARALKVVAKINELKQNKKLWEQAVDKSTQTGGLSELAVGTMGELYARTQNGKIEQISSSQYSNSPNKYKLLTVSELLNARQFDPQLTYDTNAFVVAENSVGMEKITEHIKNIIQTLGKETQSMESYIDKKDIINRLSQGLGIQKPTTEQLNQLQELSNVATSIGEGPEGIYKIKKSLESERGYLSEAFNYIWSTMPANFRQKLSAVISVSGGNAKNIQDLITNALMMQTDYSNKSEVSYEGAVNKEGDGAGKNMTNLSNIELVMSGKLNRGETFEWNDPNTGRKMSMPVTGKFNWFSEDKPVGMATIGQFNNTQTAMMLDTSKVSFGGKRVLPWDMNKIVYDGKLGAVAYMPVKSDGTPNFQLLSDFQDAQAEVESHPDWTPEQINEYYADRGIDAYVNGNKTLVPTQALRRFFIGYGWTTDKSESVENNPNVKKLTSSEENEVNDLLKPFFAASKLPMPTGMLGTYGTDYYRGIIAYPILEDASVTAAALKGNVYDKKVDINTIRTNMATQSGNLFPQGGANLLMGK